MSGDLRDNKTLIAGEDDNSSMIDSVRGFTAISIRDSSTYMGREGVTSCNGTNSATTSASGSLRTSGSTRTVGSGLVIFCGLAC